MRPLRDLVVAGEPGEDRQAGRIGRGPTCRPEPVRAQAPDRSRACPPAGARATEVVELVEPAGVAVDDQGVTVTVGGSPSFDAHTGRNRIRPSVGLVCVRERHLGLALRLADDGDRDPDRAAFPEARPEVRVHRLRRADRRHRRTRSRGHGKGVDAAVPRVVGGEERARLCRRERRPPGGGNSNRCDDGCDNGDEPHGEGLGIAAVPLIPRSEGASSTG